MAAAASEATPASLTTAGTTRSAWRSTVVPVRTSTPLATSAMILFSDSSIAGSRLRSVPSSSAEPGMTFAVDPAEMRPTERTTRLARIDAPR